MAINYTYWPEVSSNKLQQNICQFHGTSRIVWQLLNANFLSKSIHRCLPCILISIQFFVLGSMVGPQMILKICSSATMGYSLRAQLTNYMSVFLNCSITTLLNSKMLPHCCLRHVEYATISPLALVCGWSAILTGGTCT